MSNPCLKHLKKLEFVVTYACTGQCKHCSQGCHPRSGVHIDPRVAAETVTRVAAAYPLQTVMTFGGEPLLYPETVYAVMREATRLAIPRRQVITNGYFTKDTRIMGRVATELAACGVNDLLLSVDAFHEETVPVGAVRDFAAHLTEAGVPVRLQPAWLVSREDDNPYNRETQRLLQSFSDMDIPVGEGNVIFPEGNALTYLSAYFAGGAPQNPYVEDPKDIRCLSVDPHGNVLDGNLYERDVTQIMQGYQPTTV